MIELFIFHLHLLVGLHAFTKNWQKGSVIDGFLAFGVVFLTFIIGWSIIGTVVNLLFPESWNSIYFTSDTLGLILLTIPEGIFFYHFFFKDSRRQKSSRT